MATMAAGSRSQYMTAPTPPLGFPQTEKKYAFPIEPDHSILEELEKIGIADIREHDLQHPNQQIALTCFSAFLEDLCYVDDAVIKSIKDYNLQKDEVDHVEIYEESMHFIVRFNEIRALMIASRITDFAIPDITRPKPKRFKKQICALLNFHHFHKREKSYWDSFYEQWKKEDQELFDENESLRSRLPQLRAKVEMKRKEQESWKEASQVKEALKLRRLNANLLEKIEGMKMPQIKLTEEFHSLKAKKEEEERRREKLELSYEAIAEEIEKLQMRIDLNPVQLRDINEKQRGWIRDKEESRKEGERKSQSLSQKKRVLEGLERDIESCKQLVDECIEDQIRLTREQQELETIHRDSEVMAKERSNLNNQLQNSKQKLKLAIERLERMRKTIETKRSENKRKLDETSQRREEAEGQKRQRSEQANALQQGVAKIEAEYEQITRDFDAFYANLVQQKKMLERQSEEYMQAVAQRMDLQVDVM